MYCSKSCYVKDSYGDNNVSKRPEVRKKLSEIRKKNNPQGFKKGNKINVGRYWTLEMKKKHGNWNGGITPLRIQIWRCPKYSAWRKSVFERDNYTCVNCGATGVKIEAHHIKSLYSITQNNKLKNIEEARECEELWDIDNGTTLCIPCHKLTDNYRNKAKEQICYA